MATGCAPQRQMWSVRIRNMYLAAHVQCPQHDLKTESMHPQEGCMLPSAASATRRHRDIAKRCWTWSFWTHQFDSSPAQPQRCTRRPWHVWGTTVPVGGTHGGAVAPRRLIPEPDLGLKFDGMLFVVTRRELCYLNVEIKNLA